MNQQEAKDILRLYRPGLDPLDERVESALRLVDSDRELAQWWETEQALDASIAAALEATSIPEGLEKSLLARPPSLPKKRRVVLLHPAFWGSFAAAAAVFLVGAFFFRGTLIENQLLGYHPKLSQMEREPTFPAAMASYISRNRVVLDLVSSDLSAIQSTLEASPAPTYSSPAEALTALELIGCKTFQWRHQPVTLVCFELPEHRVMHLFIMEGTSHPAVAELARLHDRATAAWSDGQRNYVLVGSHPEVEVAPFVPASAQASA
jgi:hypothetical protein